MKKAWLKFKSYIHAKSLTWWTGFSSILLGISQWITDNPILHSLSEVVNTVGGGVGMASPASLIVLGLGLIGIRSKLEKM
jgi:hypothetical protein